MFNVEDTPPLASRHQRKGLRRLMTVAALAAVVGGMGMTSAPAAWRVNQATFVHQAKENWCWVAVSQAMAIWVKKTTNVPTQCDMYNFAKNTTGCPDLPGNFYQEVAAALVKGGVNNAGIVQASALSFNGVVNEVNANRLPMLRWQWDADPSTGHMLAIRGYDTASQNLSVLDPNNYGWSENVYYGWMVKGGGHTWTHSRTNIS